jgi:hypothetical protein
MGSHRFARIHGRPSNNNVEPLHAVPHCLADSPRIHTVQPGSRHGKWPARNVTGQDLRLGACSFACWPAGVGLSLLISAPSQCSHRSRPLVVLITLSGPTPADTSPPGGIRLDVMGSAVRPTRRLGGQDRRRVFRAAAFTDSHSVTPTGPWKWHSHCASPRKWPGEICAW